MRTPHTTSIEPQFRTIDGLSIRYADSGGSGEPTVLLTSPWPESIYAFAPMWATLAEHARLFAVDLPGFGASERRADLLTPRTMGEFLAGLIAEADLGRPHIVGPDVGTAAALFAAAAHPGPDRQRRDRHRRCVGAARAGRAAAVVGARPRPRQVPPDRPARVRQHCDGHHRRRGRRRHPGRLPHVLRRRPLRRIDALRPQLSRAAARARRAPPADLDAGHDHQRPPRPRRAGRQRRVPRRSPAEQPPRDHRRRPLRLGGGSGRVRLDHPRVDRGAAP